MSIVKQSNLTNVAAFKTKFYAKLGFSRLLHLVFKTIKLDFDCYKIAKTTLVK